MRTDTLLIIFRFYSSVPAWSPINIIFFYHCRYTEAVVNASVCGWRSGIVHNFVWSNFVMLFATIITGAACLFSSPRTVFFINPQRMATIIYF